MLTTAQLGYIYARGAGCPAAAQPVMTAERTEMAPVSEEVLATAGASRINPTPTTVPLTPAGPQGLTAQPSRAAGRIYLLIDGLQYDEPPGGLYNVYLKGPGGQRAQVGVINFFALAPAGATGHVHGASSSGSFRFDVTEAVRRLGISGNVQPSLVFEPTTGLTTTSPTAAAAIPPKMNAQANVRFESAKLVTGP
jgi:hypothetical protein